MTQEEIIEMAVQAGLYSGNPRTPSTGRMIEKRLEAFAKLVVTKERDRIFKNAKHIITRSEARGAAKEREAVLDLVDAYAKNNHDLRDAIRARGQE